MSAEISFVNKSLSASPVDAVFFEPAHFFDAQTRRVPWLFIQQCPYGFSHPFEYDFSMTMQLRDDCGNFSPPVKVIRGYRYNIVSVNGREMLVKEGQEDKRAIEVFNNLTEGSPEIVLSRGGKTTAIRSNLVPGEFFSFSIPDELIARKVSGYEQAKRLQQLETDGYSTVLTMQGIKQAELVLTGGGTGTNAKKYAFNLYSTD